MRVAVGELIQINAEWCYGEYPMQPMVVGDQAEMGGAQEDILPLVSRDTASTSGENEPDNRERVRCEAEDERQIAEEQRITAQRASAEEQRHILTEILATLRSQASGRPAE